jgi:hypothetical protein
VGESASTGLGATHITTAQAQIAQAWVQNPLRTCIKDFFIKLQSNGLSIRFGSASIKQQWDRFIGRFKDNSTKTGPHGFSTEANEGNEV